MLFAVERGLFKGVNSLCCWPVWTALFEQVNKKSRNFKISWAVGANKLMIFGSIDQQKILRMRMPSALCMDSYLTVVSHKIKRHNWGLSRSSLTSSQPKHLILLICVSAPLFKCFPQLHGEISDYLRYI